MTKGMPAMDEAHIDAPVDTIHIEVEGEDTRGRGGLVLSLCDLAAALGVHAGKRCACP